MRNKEMTILKAFGIIFVVMGHKYDPFKWFPIYSFHMALFFFISGYFYKEKYEDNILLYTFKKIKNTVPVYFIFNLFYMVVTYVLYKKYNFILGRLPSLKGFFITPFINGHQYHLFLAAWFVIALLIIQIVFIIMYKYIKKINNNIHTHLIIFFFIGILATCMAKYITFQKESPLIILIRTCFGLFFYYLGFYYKQNENRKVFTSFNALIVIILQVILIINIENTNYQLVWGEFYGNVFSPFITSINAIYIYLFISKALSKVLKENDIIYKIGEHTVSIMFNHLFIFFLINYIILKLTNGNLSKLSNIWYTYKLSYYWIVYTILGVLVPVYLACYYEIIKKKILGNEKFKYISGYKFKKKQKV